KANRKSIKLVEQLPEWFNAFGVSVASAQNSIPSIIQSAMHDWFDDPTRLMVAFRLSSDPDIAAWQLAVTHYVAEYWDVHARGLDTVHFVAEIEGCPNFRKYWTSNK
ncbi:hypothetical protein, partial [Aquisphaera insulae]|uniref:hypothetical protein n=1 Tax=Aquisphaera insulae TaxID=2712864 RepID=UPI00196B0371